MSLVVNNVDSFFNLNYIIYVVKTENRDGKPVNVVVDRIGKVAHKDAWKWWRK